MNQTLTTIEGEIVALASEHAGAVADEVVSTGILELADGNAERLRAELTAAHIQMLLQLGLLPPEEQSKLALTSLLDLARYYAATDQPERARSVVLEIVRDEDRAWNQLNRFAKEREHSLR